jgi:vancomycin permeability regulator SanA
MSNPLFQQMNMGVGGNPMSSLMQRFQQFQQMFKGDPRQQVQNLLNSGKVSQSQYNQAVQMAQQFQKLMGGK